MKEPANPIRAFGQVVREVRITRGWSQQVLAYECDLDRSFLALVETGKKQPSLTTIFLLATGLRIEASELLRLVERRLAENT